MIFMILLTKSVVLSETDRSRGRHERRPFPASFQGTQMYSNYVWRSECIPKSSGLISAHLSLFSLPNTMPFIPNRIIGLHCRRQTIYWHFASLSSAVSLPGTIHFKQYMFCCAFLECNNSQRTSQEPLNRSQLLQITQATCALIAQLPFYA